MREHLCLKSGDGREFADRNGVSAINQMPVRDSGVVIDNQFGPAIRLVREMP
jgi:hypothetical protein